MKMPKVVMVPCPTCGELLMCGTIKAVGTTTMTVSVNRAVVLDHMQVAHDMRLPA